MTYHGNVILVLASPSVPGGKMKIMEVNMKKLVSFVLVILMVLALCGCDEASRVSYNVGKEADNFIVTRRITVFNIRTDTVLMQMTGKMSLQNNSSNELVVLVEVEKGTYQKHFIYLNEYTMYTVEDLNGTEVSPYSYELEFLPQTLQPVKITAHEVVEDIVGNG